jgi:hypothetical protein
MARGVRTVGLTSGASVPEMLVQQVLGWLAQRGYADVERVVAAEEKVVFALPHELKRSMATAAADRRGFPSGSIARTSPVPDDPVAADD